MSELLTIQQVAEILGVSPETVTRRFAREKGVIDLAPTTEGRGNAHKRRYRVLRIPSSVVEKWIARRGGRITIEPEPAKPTKPTRTPTVTEDDITRDLALLASQHGAAARETLDRIARRARLMSFVPKDRWQDLVWLDSDEDE